MRPYPISGEQLTAAAAGVGLRIEEKLNVGGTVAGSLIAGFYGRPQDRNNPILGIELLASVPATVARQKLVALSRPAAMHAFRVGNVLGWHRARRGSAIDGDMRELAVRLSQSCRCPLYWFR